MSRGLLHYYFGTKERLLVEVVRRESDVRVELLEQAVAGAAGADEVIDALVRSFEQMLGEGSSASWSRSTSCSRSVSATRRSPPSWPTWRSARGAAGRGAPGRHEAGVFELRAAAGDVASFLFALADGVTIRRLSEPALDVRPLMDQAVAAARALLA